MWHEGTGRRGWAGGGGQEGVGKRGHVAGGDMWQEGLSGRGLVGRGRRGHVGLVRGREWREGSGRGGAAEGHAHVISCPQ